MGGALTHLSIGLISALGVFYLFKFQSMHAIGIFIGNAVPDILKFGIAGLSQGTLNPAAIQHDALFRGLSVLTSSYTNWVGITLFAIFGVFALYHYHYLKKNEMEDYAWLYIFLLLGIITHLVVDVLVQESSIWI